MSPRERPENKARSQLLWPEARAVVAVGQLLVYVTKSEGSCPSGSGRSEVKVCVCHCGIVHRASWVMCSWLSVWPSWGVAAKWYLHVSEYVTHFREKWDGDLVQPVAFGCPLGSALGVSEEGAHGARPGL